MQKYLCLSILTVFINLLTSNNSFADHDYNNPIPKIRAGINFERLFINHEAASSQLIDETATAVNLSLNFGNQSIEKPYIDFGAGLSFIAFNDNGQFWQETVDEYGHIFTANSRAKAFHVYFEAGPNMPISRYTNIDVKAGYTLPITSERSIDNCSACYSEEIDLDTGAYGQIGLSHKIGNFSLKSRYKYYINNNNGIEDSFSLGFDIGY